MKYLVVPLDKQLHLLWCFCICVFASIAHPLAGIAAALAAGFFKEWRDSRMTDNDWSWGDIAFDVVGVASAIIALYLLGERYGL